ncbi:DUF1524 domain-containing protein [Nocardia sp. NPDC004654]|uniref:GmrSD restriction endonuclease domain-containing protein n=1 Tax=Nocardia sp. NPDC004654 TaxID=3154776 RepID=UPI0033A71437
MLDTLRTKLDKDEVDVSLVGSPSRGRSGIRDLALNQFSKRYIFHRLARLTSYIESSSDMPDLFDKYVDRTSRNSYDIEHIWADDYVCYADHFGSKQAFDSYRNNVGGLLLLPADVNRSYQAKPFEDRVTHYARQNLLAASLAEAAYQHQPRFKAFVEREGLPFEAYEKFGPEQQEQRRELVLMLAQRVWDPNRLEQYRA